MYVCEIRCEVQLLYYLVQSAHGYMFSLSTNKYHLPLLAAPYHSWCCSLTSSIYIIFNVDDASFK